MFARIIFWQPIDSPHQEAFLEAVAEQFAGEVILGVEQDLPAERVAQGWRKAVHKKVKVVDISIPANHVALAAHSSADSLHVFTGFFSHPLVWSGFRKLAPSQARLAIMSEAPEQPLLTGWLKRLRGRVLTRRWAHRFAFVLAIGGVGCEFFKSIGFPKEKIIPFGYYLDVPPLTAAEPSRQKDDVFRFISAGQLIHRKGIDILIKACGRLPAKRWRLDIYGDGPERPALERLTTRLKLSGSVTFHGAVPNDKVHKALAFADCAVLPSRFDGWGMLANESLACGSPFVCTGLCGAAVLLTECQGSASLPASTVSSLSVALQKALAAGHPSDSSRASLAVAFRDVGSARVAAERFLVAVRASV